MRAQGAPLSHVLHNLRCRTPQKRWNRRPAADPYSGIGYGCPRCGNEIHCAGPNFAALTRSDKPEWPDAAAILTAGPRFHGYEPCGCGREPKYPPRTRAELRARSIHAARHASPPAAAQTRRNPWTAAA
ncbi:hypothetical protein GCM10011588_70090 [Nocardia jinanensis]|uniref:Uncharacterized protein n=1 Tax=Nocardia jinanensis TaxID=382504 RepID=A0A917RYP7_9NOCA|nr:hypothetical protein GCM10011588_70090 [Nocardia jinanensis]